VRWGPSLKAVVLAAGVARRLAPLTDHTHKCLLPVGGRSLLDRMLEALARSGVEETVIVVGHVQERVRAEAGRTRGAMKIRCLENPDYQKGSILSLWQARDVLRGHPTLVMDADVLFPPVLLTSLIAAPVPNALLLDRSFDDTGEEVKLYTIGPRVVALGKKFVPECWETVGEGVGFFKCAREHGVEFVRQLAHSIEETGGINEYEDALHRLLSQVAVGWVDITGLPWTEVDFVEDWQRADEQVWPRIARLEER
jgi:L-glutamine-phosphate cytidylyltransferase